MISYEKDKQQDLQLKKLDKIINEIKINKISSYTKEYINNLFFSYSEKLPSNIDFVVVLASDSPFRPKAAAKVYEQIKKPIICSGGGKIKYKGIEALWYKKILLKNKVLLSDIIIEDKSKNSYQNIEFSLEKILKENKNPHILFISSSFHLSRVDSIIKRVKKLKKYEFTYSLYPSYGKQMNKDKWFECKVTRNDFALELNKLRQYGIIREGNMRSYLDNLIEKQVIPGCNYAIIHNEIEKGSIDYKAIIPNKELNSIDVLYDMASLSKVIVTVTVLTKLLERKQISLQDKVKTYLPNYKYDSTIFDLMTHTSGLKADFAYETVCSFKSKEELITACYNEELGYEPKSDVIYSDLGYIFLGLIIEKIMNKPLDMVAKEEVFIPLKMNSTTYNPANKNMCAPTEITDSRGVVRGVVHDEKALLMGGCCGTAGVFSNLDDVIKFVEMIMNDGMVDGKQFVSKQSIELWNTPLVTEKSGFKRSFCWLIGHSKTTGTDCSETTMGFTGFTGPTIVIDKENNVSLILLTNRIHPTRENRLLIDERTNIMNEVIRGINQKSL